ncbi:hypothetical protein A2215_02155 [Candidatus Berkelbacteria bacterium RIFOXYA2_FULL_43_10]|uniref:Transcription regulator TrmB N-terminal domain-containing protein n=1 Tax=Candidatus Berkelbacteria bacterium RIFOXYA2_FULL_43_10 TaxID=1797472 RepID=A0A1F5E3C5_9BACT|nr:MAG: hypothetical protein A2215_02155 [Candidatus Berkelbacteria bacterium RIFOXYA2_FULL_43_10]
MNKGITSKLESIGFSRQDAEVYLALLKRGESRAGEIIEETCYHREIVYSALGRLERDGLVQSITKKGIKYFQAAKPEKVIDKINEKADIAKKLLPTLESIYKEIPLAIQVFEGSGGYEEVQKDIQVSLKDRDRFFVIGGAGDAWYKVTEPYYKKYQKLFLKRGIQMLTVTSIKEAEGIAKHEDPRVNPIRVMPSNFSAPSSTLFYADKVVIQVFGESPVAIMIRSKAVSNAYKKYFEALWNISEEFEY